MSPGSLLMNYSRHGKGGKNFFISLKCIERLFCNFSGNSFAQISKHFDSMKFSMLFKIQQLQLKALQESQS